MDRRGFAGGLAAAGLCPGTAAVATVRGNEREGMPTLAHIFLLLGGRFTPGIPSRFIVISDNFSHEIGVDFKFPMENEKRSSVLNPTLQRQFASTVKIGDIRADGRTIWADTTEPVKPNELRITDFEISFRVNGKKLARPYNGAVPVFSRLPLIGYLFRRASDTELRRNLMVYITPEVLDYAE